MTTQLKINNEYTSEHLREIAKVLKITEHIKETSEEDASIRIKGEVVGRCRTRLKFVTLSLKIPPEKCKEWREKLKISLGETHYSRNYGLKDQDMIIILQFKKELFDREPIKELIKYWRENLHLLT